MKSKKKEEGKTHNIKTGKIVLPLVDEELSHNPFFQVYRYPKERSISKSLKRSIEMTPEIPIAKLFVNNFKGFPGLLIFTNHGIIELSLVTRPRGFIHFLSGILERIPIINLTWALITELPNLIYNVLGKSLKLTYKHAERLISLSDKIILEKVKLKIPDSKLAKGIRVSRMSYSEVIKQYQPCLGISIQFRNFSLISAKFRVTTLRILPLGIWFELTSFWGGAAECFLPDREIIPKISQLVQALPKNIPARLIFLGPREIRLLWPEEIGVGTKKWSMYAATFVVLLLFCIFLILVMMGISGEETAYWFALIAGVGAIHSIIDGHTFGRAVGYGIGTIFLMFYLANSIGLFR